MGHDLKPPDHLGVRGIPAQPAFKAFTLFGQVTPIRLGSGGLKINPFSALRPGRRVARDPPVIAGEREIPKLDDHVIRPSGPGIGASVFGFSP